MQKQYGCSKFLTVNFNDTQLFARVKHLGKHYTQLKTSRRINDIRDTGPDTENTNVRICIFTDCLSTNQNREF